MKTEEVIENGVLIINSIYEDSDFSTYEQKESWKSICNSCQYKKDESCQYCGCLLVNLYTFSSSKCPNNQW